MRSGRCSVQPAPRPRPRPAPPARLLRPATLWPLVASLGMARLAVSAAASAFAGLIRPGASSSQRSRPRARARAPPPQLLLLRSAAGSSAVGGQERGAASLPAAATGQRGPSAAGTAASGGGAGAPGSHGSEDAAAAAARITQHALYRVRDVNRRPPAGLAFLDFVVDGARLGVVSEPNAQLLVECGGGGAEVFRLAGDGGEEGEMCLTFSGGVGPTFEERTEAVASVARELHRDGIVRGWRDELYPVSRTFYDPPAFAMERAAVPLLGAIEYGVHVNGIVLNEGAAGSAAAVKVSPPPPHRMWMARRSMQKSKFPGMLDHVVAGGQPLGMSLLDNVIKECHEEAGIPEDLARQGIRAASAISYETYVESSQTISRAVLFNYDLYLPPTFVPIPVDGEVDEFFLWTIEDVLASLDPDFHDPIKPNCYSVIVDFLVRHGHLSPDTPGYLDVVRELRSGDCR